jgi:hypothetical protein
MSERNYILNEADEKFLVPSELKRHADYAGDNDVRLAMRAMARKLLLKDNPNMNASKVATFLDTKIEHMHLSARCMNVIRSTGYRTFRELYEGGWGYMIRQINFGERSKLEVTALFASYGLIWRAECQDAPTAPAPLTATIPVTLLQDLVMTANLAVTRFEKENARSLKTSKFASEYKQLLEILDRAERALTEARQDAL